MNTEKPTKFEDLAAAELYRSALEDFALPVEADEKNKKKVLLAAFVEGGVGWSDYLEQHPALAPEPVVAQEPVAIETPVEVITSNAPKHNTVNTVQALEPNEKWDDANENVREAAVVARPVVAAAPLVQQNQDYLIKMVRDNALFEVRGHKFTDTHPYAIVNAQDADHILTREEGFRQATPSELQEFYG